MSQVIGQFAPIPVEVLASELKPVDKMVYSVLAFHAPNIYPSVDTIAAVAGICRRRAFLALKNLRAAGFIEWVRTGRSNQYYLPHIPKTLEAFKERVSRMGKKFLDYLERRKIQRAYLLKSQSKYGGLGSRSTSRAERKGSPDMHGRRHKPEEETRTKEGEGENFTPMPENVKNLIANAFSGRVFA